MKTAEDIVRTLHQPILVLDGTLRPLIANSAFYRMFGLAPTDLKGKLIREVISGPICKPGLRLVLDPVIASDSDVEDFEVVCTLPTGEQAVVLVNARRIHAGKGVPSTVLVELRDITREKEAERRTERLNEVLQKHVSDVDAANMELESYSDSISHDLKIPLRFMNRIAHLLLEDYGPQLPSGARQQLNMLTECTCQMARLIEKLLVFSRVTRKPMRKRRIDLRRLVEEVLGEQQQEQDGRRIEVMIQDLVPCQADRTLVREVVMNLVANALKFTRRRETARITIGCTETEGETAYFVQDNGVGFDMRDSDLLFLPFHRLHKAADFEGAGIGLALAKRIVERHGGRIWAAGAVDKGATFYFTLSKESAGQHATRTKGATA
jgi:PAS domain S-box-containing protein